SSARGGTRRRGQPRRRKQPRQTRRCAEAPRGAAPLGPLLPAPLHRAGAQPQERVDPAPAQGGRNQHQGDNGVKYVPHGPTQPEAREACRDGDDEPDDAVGAADVGGHRVILLLFAPNSSPNGARGTPGEGPSETGQRPEHLYASRPTLGTCGLPPRPGSTRCPSTSDTVRPL